MKKFTLFLVRFYQRTSFFHKQIFRTFFLTDKVCKFTPTCSQYTYESIEKYGVLKGGFFALARIIRCHPWSRGGYDPVK